jgi:hypothetical protein
LFSTHFVGFLLSIGQFFQHFTCVNLKTRDRIKANVGVAIVLPTVVGGFQQDGICEAITNLQVNAYRRDDICESLAVLGMEAVGRSHKREKGIKKGLPGKPVSLLRYVLRKV